MGWREATAEEQAVLSLAEIEAGLTQFERDYSERLKTFQEDSARLIGEWIRKGKLDPAKLTDADTLASFPGRDQLQADLVDLMGGMAQFGKDQLDAELARLGVVVNAP